MLYIMWELFAQKINDIADTFGRYCRDILFIHSKFLSGKMTFCFCMHPGGFQQSKKTILKYWEQAQENWKKEKCRKEDKYFTGKLQLNGWL